MSHVVRVLVRLVVQYNERSATGGSAVATHFRAALAVRMGTGMKLAFIGTTLANFNAGCKQGPN